MEWIDPTRPLAVEEAELPTSQPEWYHSVALGIDPSQGAVYDYTTQYMKDLLGVDETDAMDDYTYYGLPSAAANPNTFGDYD